MRVDLENIRSDVNAVIDVLWVKFRELEDAEAKFQARVAAWEMKCGSDNSGKFLTHIKSGPEDFSNVYYTGKEGVAEEESTFKDTAATSRSTSDAEIWETPRASADVCRTAHKTSVHVDSEELTCSLVGLSGTCCDVTAICDVTASGQVGLHTALRCPLDEACIEHYDITSFNEGGTILSYDLEESFFVDAVPEQITSPRTVDGTESASKRASFEASTQQSKGGEIDSKGYLLDLPPAKLDEPDLQEYRDDTLMSNCGTADVDIKTIVGLDCGASKDEVTATASPNRCAGDTLLACTEADWSSRRVREPSTINSVDHHVQQDFASIDHSSTLSTVTTISNLDSTRNIESEDGTCPERDVACEEDHDFRDTAEPSVVPVEVQQRDAVRIEVTPASCSSPAWNEWMERTPSPELRVGAVGSVSLARTRAPSAQPVRRARAPSVQPVRSARLVTEAPRRASTPIVRCACPPCPAPCEIVHADDAAYTKTLKSWSAAESFNAGISDVFAQCDADGDGILTWNKREVMHFVRRVFALQQLEPPQEVVVYAMYRRYVAARSLDVVSAQALVQSLIANLVSRNEVGNQHFGLPGNLTPATPRQLSPQRVIGGCVVQQQVRGFFN